MKKLLVLAMVSTVGLFFTSCEKELTEDLAPTPEMKKPGGAGTNFTIPNRFDASGVTVIGNTGSNYVVGDPMELWMGVGNAKAGTLVGSATFITVGGVDKVRIDLTDSDADGVSDMYPYVLTVAHIDFASTQAGIAQTKKGNPIPGQFDYNYSVPAGTTVMEFDITNGFEEFGAIHLDVVKYGGISGFNFYLPDYLVTMSVTSSTNSYLTLAITGAGLISDYDSGNGPGRYTGWCVANDLLIYLNTSYSAMLYSSYEPIPANVVTAANLNVANLDNINWLLNNYNVGDEVFAPDGVTSYGYLTITDIQHAMWNLSNFKTYTGNKTVSIVNDALTNGEGFIPVCGDEIVFLAVPTTTTGVVNAQLITGPLPVPCADEGGTAWGDGYWGATFDGKNWGTWFEYGAN